MVWKNTQREKKSRKKELPKSLQLGQIQNKKDAQLIERKRQCSILFANLYSNTHSGEVVYIKVSSSWRHGLVWIRMNDVLNEMRKFKGKLFIQENYFQKKGANKYI